MADCRSTGHHQFVRRLSIPHSASLLLSQVTLSQDIDTASAASRVIADVGHPIFPRPDDTSAPHEYDPLSPLSSFRSPSSSSSSDVPSMPRRSPRRSSPYSLAPPPPRLPSPFTLISRELGELADEIRSLVDTDHPVLKIAASHFFSLANGKKFRPGVVLLLGKAADVEQRERSRQVDDVSKRQTRLGQVTEMIHTASLIHDDVVDDADTRRGKTTVHKIFNNKVAVLAGDFLLARASVLLARLGSNDVVELMATALDSLVTGEVMQARASPEERKSFSWYIRKSYFKTASLIACSAKSSLLLGGFDVNHPLTRAAEKFGYHLGIAFQIIDDLLDFTQTSSVLGKPTLADLANGHATAPILFAAAEKRELLPLIERRFKNPGDVEEAFALLSQTKGIQQAREYAMAHAEEALHWLEKFPCSPPRDALAQLTAQVLHRSS